MVEFKVGDRVRFISNDRDWIDLTQGNVYVVRQGEWGDIVFLDDVGDERDISNFGLDELELVTEPPTSSPFVREVVTKEYGGVFGDPVYPEIEVQVSDEIQILIHQDDPGYEPDEIYISRDRLKAFAKALLELAEALLELDEALESE